MNISILYEDNHVLVVEKPVNIPVQADSSGDLDLLTLLKQDLKKRYNKPGNVFLGLIHRLDRPVGGAMVFAKTSKAASRLSDLMRRQEITRHYLAVVRGTPIKKKTQLEHYLLKDTKKNKVSVVSSQQSKAKKAVLEYNVFEKNKNMALLAVKLHTGRPHQIRVQLSSVGLPLYGDQKYGSLVNQSGQQLALWARYLEFKHPVKDTIIKVHSAPPEQHPWTLWRETATIHQ